jgi:hypothetical protein
MRVLCSAVIPFTLAAFLPHQLLALPKADVRIVGSDTPVVRSVVLDVRSDPVNRQSP